VAATGRLIHRDKILGRRLTIPAWFEIILNALAFAQIRSLCVDILGAAPERIGAAPKTMLIYRAAAGMTKRKTACR
jgi:hypothetical protein